MTADALDLATLATLATLAAIDRRHGLPGTGRLRRSRGAPGLARVHWCRVQTRLVVARNGPGDAPLHLAGLRRAVAVLLGA